MDTATKASGQKTSVTKRGGYEPGPKSMSDLKPPPRNLGAGSKPRPTSDK